jgi:hypothetical protein
LTNVVQFPQQGKGGGGPEDPILEKRVAVLEAKFDRIDGALARLEPAVREIAVDNRKQHIELLNRIAAVEGRLAGIDGQLDGVKGRLALIPSVWQAIAILGTLPIGISGVLFTASRLFHP